MPKYLSEDKDNYDVPPTPHEELSAKETIERSRFENFSQIVQNSFKTGSVPACCICNAKVEPDGECPGGNPSVMVKKNIV